MKILFNKRFALSVVLLTLSACSETQTSANVEVEQKQSYQYIQPDFQDDGWTTGNLADVDFDPIQITDLINKIQDNTYSGIDSISLVRKNILVLHEDFRESFSIYDDWLENRDLKKHIMHSTSKSFVSALMGIAIEQGYINSVENNFYNYFDYSEYENWDQQKNAITLDNVLSMRLGLEWDEWSYPNESKNNSLTNLISNNNDLVKALLDLPLKSSPGESYAYNTIASIALGEVIEKATNQSLTNFAEQYLFSPLQINNAQWLKTPTDKANTGSGLFLKTRDMAKIGQLYLNQGMWNGYQIIDPNWIKQSLEKHSHLVGNYTTGYGYQWWLGDFKYQDQMINFYSSRGFGGQFVIIVPKFELVIAFTAHNYDNDLYELPFQLVEDYILPAIKTPSMLN